MEQLCIRVYKWENLLFSGGPIETGGREKVAFAGTLLK